MEDYELLDPVPGLKPSPAAPGPKMHLNLSATEKLILVQWVGSNSYNVFVKLANGEIEKMETHHLQNWRDKEYFERTGLVAVGVRMFFERLQSEFNHQVEEFAGEVAFAKQDQETERVKKDDPESLIEQM